MQVNAVSCCCCSRALLISLTRIRKTFHVLLSCVSSVIRRSFYAPTFILQHTATELDRVVDDRVRSREPMMTAIAKPCVSVSDLFSLSVFLSLLLSRMGRNVIYLCHHQYASIRVQRAAIPMMIVCVVCFFFVSLLHRTSPSCQQPSPPIPTQHLSWEANSKKASKSCLKAHLPHSPLTSRIRCCVR